MKHQHIYEEIYADPKRYRGYGSTNHGRQAYGIIEKLKPQSVVDLGCGDNSFLRHRMFAGIRTVGVDFAHPAADVQASLVDLPFAWREFDLVTSFDCLEHLDPDEVQDSLREICRIGKRFVLHIAFRDSFIRAPDGSTLHPTVRSREWWEAAIMDVEDVDFHINTGDYIVGEWL